jgi:hypothetical protein
MANLTFTQSLYPLLYVGQQLADDRGWCGYLLPPDSPPAEAAIRLVQSFEELEGSYLFAPMPPDLSTLESATEFAEAVAAIISTVNSRTILWLLAPSHPEQANTRLLGFRRGTTRDFEITDALQAPLTSSLDLQVAANMILALEENTLTIRNNREGKITFTGMAAPVVKIQDDAILPFEGNQRGCVQFSVFMERRSSIQSLRWGFQYYFPTGGAQPSTARQFYPLAMPVEPDPATFIGFYASLDPTNIYNQYAYGEDGNALRTFFAFTGRNEPAPFETIIPSYFRTDTGYKITLLPIAPAQGNPQSELSTAKLVFARAAQSGVAGVDAYLTPQGGFRMRTDDTLGATHLNLLCGLAGTETIAFARADAAGAGDILSFHPHQPAHALRFPLPPVNLREPDSPPVSEVLLDDTYTTAWATVTPGEVNPPGVPNVYYSQPHGASLYVNNSETTDDDRPATLDFYRTKMADLGGATAGESFPLVPYAGVVVADGLGTPGALSLFESQIISQTRKQRIIALKRRNGFFNLPAALAPDAVTVPATTPQGLLARVATDAASRWQSLQMAHNKVRGTNYDLLFRNVDPVLQDAFQTNQQFFVVTQPQQPWNSDAGTRFSDIMLIEDWPFRLLVGTGNAPGDYRNVLIFKFVKGKLSELIKNPSSWTSAAEFNETEGQGLAFLSQWLQDYIAETHQLAEAEAQAGLRESYFAKFLDIVDSETWNGILALKVQIDLGLFPAELKGLLGGIDLTRFNAHHFAVEVNFVEAVRRGVRVSGNSSLFGLIYYVDAAYQAQLSLGGSPDRPVVAAPGDFDFKVLTLKVLFENTAVKTFESKLQVTANRWFGDQVTSMVTPAGETVDLPSNSIILDGAYEEQNGRATFTFTSNSDRLFRLNSNVLGAVETVQAQFSTLTDAGGSASGFVRSRFAFTGYMNFMPATGFDLFSFGSDWTDNQPGTRAGLYFSNLYIEMEFPLLTPSERTFTFNPDFIAFNLEQSRARPASFFPNFPLKLAGITSGTAEQGPDKLGFLPVSIEAPFTGLKGSWNGLQFQLDLGTAGALTENAGLTATLIGAWSPASGGTVGAYDVLVGLKLPGAGGGAAKLLSLQGIFGVGIDNIELLLGQTQDGRPAYLLKLTQLALQFLGLKFPRSGNTVFFLFGDPNPGAPQNSLGWYAAYNRET